MNFIRNNRKKLEIVFFGLLIVFFLANLIITLTRASDFSEMRDAIKQLEDTLGSFGGGFAEEQLDMLKEQYASAITPFIFEVFACIISLVGSVLGLVFTVKNKTTKSIFLTVGIALIGTSIYYLSNYGAQVSDIIKAANNMGGYDIEIVIPDEIITLVVFGALVLIGSIVTMAIPFGKIKANQIVGIVTAFLLFITTCIELSWVGQAEITEFICVAVFNLLASFVIIFACLLLNDVITNVTFKKPVFNANVNNSAIPATNVEAVPGTLPTTDPTRVSPTVAPVVNQAPVARVNTMLDSINEVAEVLRTLKKLLDEGLITEEEHQDIRKKYVNKL